MKLPSLCLLMFCVSFASAVEIRLRVVDDDGIPVAGAEVTISFSHSDPALSSRTSGRTDAGGRFSGRGERHELALARATREGYYEAFARKLPAGKDLDVTLVLRKIRQPIPLFAKHVTRRIPLPVQEKDSWVVRDTFSLDLEVGDFLPPHGKGRTADLVIRTFGEFLGWRLSAYQMEEARRHPSSQGKSEAELRLNYGQWQGFAEISFSSPDDGLVEERGRFLTYSQLQMPHQAPAEGYEPTLRVRSSYLSQERYGMYDWEHGYFLRTRTKRDHSGRVVSAHYAKVVGGFQVGPAGGVEFFYHFNPSPNDRNLEYSMVNLFPNEIPPQGAPVR